MRTEICFECLWGCIVRLPEATMQVGTKDIPGGNRVFTRKDLVFIFLHYGCEDPIFPGVFHFLVVAIFGAGLSSTLAG